MDEQSPACTNKHGKKGKKKRVHFVFERVLSIA